MSDSHLSDQELDAAITACAAGDDAAADTLCRLLTFPVRTAVLGFLHARNLDADDVIQDTLLAVCLYIRRNDGFSGNIIKFAVTVARNRCRNIINWQQRRPHQPVEPMAEWLANNEQSPLDLLLADEVGALLQATLSELDARCHQLLRAFYLEDKTIETIRQETDLKTVQGIYYRRAVCLQRMCELLKIRLSDCSSLQSPD
ncbi:MAG: sigma-70 family RNA polymerase sigma factor [bacterium]